MINQNIIVNFIPLIFYRYLIHFYEYVHTTNVYNVTILYFHMEVWIRERVLQRYIIENKNKFKLHNKTIISIKDNKDQYPDIYCILEDGTEIPVEIEWKTSNFFKHGHDVNILLDNDGILMVCTKDQEIGFDIPQIEIDINDFERWFVDNAKRIITDTTSTYKNTDKSRRPPKLFLIYLSSRSDSVNNFKLALQHMTWGVPKNPSSFVLRQFILIKKDDLVIFIGPGKGFSGRLNFQKWSKRSFSGKFECATMFRVTRGYFFDEQNKIWIGRGKYDGEVFPHRFEFDPNPLLDLLDIPIKKLFETTKKETHTLIYKNFYFCQSFYFT